MRPRTFEISTGRDAATRVLAAALFALLVAALWLAYRPGLSGPYVFDDFQNITRNSLLAIDALTVDNLKAAALSNADAGLGRPLSMASFALNHFFAGSSFDSFAFKLTNLAIHMINALLVFFVAARLLRLRAAADSTAAPGVDERRIMLTAIFAAGLWALHPIQLTSVLYAVQRMTSMSALFVFAGLLVFIHGRCRMAQDDPRALGWMAGGLAGGSVFGLLCKENAVLLPLLAAAVELFFFSRETLPPRARRRLGHFYLFFVLLPVLAAAIYVLANPEFVLRAYANRSFSLTERVLTESRVLFFYLSLIFVPLISRFGLYHDDFPLSTALLDPPTTLLALVGWLIIGAALIAGARRRSLWAFALTWFLVGHAMESTVIGLEIIHEHRNYVPSFGVLLAVAFYLALLISKSSFSPRIAGAGAVCILLVFSFVTHTRAQAWSSRASLFQTLVRHHPGSYRALAGLAVAMREQGRDARAVYRVLRDAAMADPNTVGALVEMQKMLHALIPASDRVLGEVAPSAVVDPSLPAWAKDALLDREHLTELDRQVAAETARRLELNGAHPETIYALWTAQNCVLNGRENCLPLLDRLLGWHMLMLDKLPQANTRRGRLELSVAKLLAVRGEIDQALVYVDRAIETMANDPRYRIQKALLLVKLGALDEAERIAATIEKEMDWRNLYVRDLISLRQAIDNARRTGSGGTHAAAEPVVR